MAVNTKVPALDLGILPDDRAVDVFRKVTTAAEIVLDRALPRLLDGTAKALAQAESGRASSRRRSGNRPAYRPAAIPSPSASAAPEHRPVRCAASP